MNGKGAKSAAYFTLVVSLGIHITQKCVVHSGCTSRGASWQDYGEYDLMALFLRCGRLHECAPAPPVEVDDKLRWKLTLQLAEGIAYLHRRNIVHRCARSSTEERVRPNVSHPTVPRA